MIQLHCAHHGEAVFIAEGPKPHAKKGFADGKDAQRRYVAKLLSRDPVLGRQMAAAPAALSVLAKVEARVAEAGGDAALLAEIRAILALAAV